MHVKFFNQPVENKVKSREEGRPIFEPKRYCTVVKDGGHTLTFPVDDFKLEQMLHGNRDHRVNDLYGRAYSAYKNVDENVYEGLLVEQWSVITREDAESLKRLGIMTVEQLAEAGGAFDDRAKEWGRNLKEKAKTFLAACSDDSTAIAKVEKLEMAIKDLEGTIALRDERIYELEAEVTMLKRERKELAGGVAAVKEAVDVNDEVLEEVHEAISGGELEADDVTVPTGAEDVDGAILEEVTEDVTEEDTTPVFGSSEEVSEFVATETTDENTQNVGV